MSRVILVKELSPDKITDQGWWQVFIVLLTALLTTFLAHYFTNLSKRSSQLIYAKANLSKFAYHLDQVTTSYLESLLNSYYYMVVVQNTTGDLSNMNSELMRTEGIRSADLALEISKTNSTMISELSIIRQLSGYSATKKLDQLFNAVVYFEGYNIPRPSESITTRQQANKYAKENLEYIKKNSEQLKKKVKILTDELNNLKVANAPFKSLRDRK